MKAQLVHAEVRESLIHRRRFQHLATWQRQREAAASSKAGDVGRRGRGPGRGHTTWAAFPVGSAGGRREEGGGRTTGVACVPLHEPQPPHEALALATARSSHVLSLEAADPPLARLAEVHPDGVSFVALPFAGSPPAVWAVDPPARVVAGLGWAPRHRIFALRLALGPAKPDRIVFLDGLAGTELAHVELPAQMGEVSSGNVVVADGFVAAGWLADDVFAIVLTSGYRVVTWVDGAGEPALAGVADVPDVALVKALEGISDVNFDVLPAAVMTRAGAAVLVIPLVATPVPVSLLPLAGASLTSPSLDVLETTLELSGTSATVGSGLPSLFDIHGTGASAARSGPSLPPPHILDSGFALLALSAKDDGDGGVRLELSHLEACAASILESGLVPVALTPLWGGKALVHNAGPQAVVVDVWTGELEPLSLEPPVHPSSVILGSSAEAKAELGYLLVGVPATSNGGEPFARLSTATLFEELCVYVVEKNGDARSEQETSDGSDDEASSKARDGEVEPSLGELSAQIAALAGVVADGFGRMEAGMAALAARVASMEERVEEAFSEAEC